MTEIEIANGIEMVTAMVTRRTDMSYFVVSDTTDILIGQTRQIR